jgi:decaprenylphospho-beta-D-erythro-pentofuranosid-2-ulose 2-reductase
MAIRSSQEAEVMLNGFKNPGRVVLIGGNSEIGRAVVEHLPALKSREVISTSRTGDYALDVTNRAAREACITALFDEADVDLVIIAVGVLGNDSHLSAADNLLNAIEVNYTATAHFLTLITERMKKQSHGQILVISSFAQVRPRPDNFGYGSTKAGIDFFARGLASTLKGTGVSIKILRPGFVTSKMTTGMDKAPFSISAEECGKYGAKALQSGKLVTWAPSLLKYVAFIFKSLPPAIFSKISSR